MCRSTCSTSPGGPSSTGWGRWPGTFDLDLAHAVAAPDADDRLLTVDLVTELIDRSLVVADATGTRTRYRLLELVRDYARDALRAEGRWNEANERLTEVLASEADAILRDGVTSWSAELISRVIENVGNLSTALDWCIAHDARPRPSGAPLPPPLRRRPPEPLRRGAGPRGSHPGALALRARPVAGRGAGCPGHRVRRRGPAPTLLRAGPRSAHRRRPDGHRRGGGPPCPHHRRHRRGRRRSVRSSTPRPDGRSRAPRDCTRSSASWRASRRHSSTGMATPTKPSALAHEAAAASVAAGDQITEIWARLVIATVAMRSGRFDAARAAIDQAQATSHAIQGVWWGGAIFRSQALLASYEATAAGGDDGWEASRELWRRAIQQAARRGDLPELALTLKLAAVVAARADHLTTAHALLDAVPPTPEVTVLPELFEEERVELESARPAGRTGCSSEPGRCASSRPQRDRHAGHGRAGRRRACAPEVRPATAGAGGRRLGRSLGRVHRSGPRCEGGARPRGPPRSAPAGGPRPGAHGRPRCGSGTGPRHRRRRPSSVPGPGDRAAGGHRGGPAQQRSRAAPRRPRSSSTSSSSS